MAVVLVTGDLGMVGHAVCDLFRNNNKYKGLDLRAAHRTEYDLRKEQSVRALYELMRPDYVIHCAAKVGGVKFNKEHPDVLFRDNILMNTHMIHYAHHYGVKKLIAFSSACAFQDGVYPFREDKLQDGRPYEGNLAYGYAKRMVDVQIGIYNQLYGRKDLTVIPVSIYGPCFSKDTEVFSPTGIKNIKDIKVGDEVFTLNPDNHTVEIAKVIATQISHTNELYHFSSKYVDFKVTPDHAMYGKIGNGGFKKIRADWFSNKIGRDFGQFTFATHEPIEIPTTTDEFSLQEYIDSDHLYNEGHVRDFAHSSSNSINTKYRLEDIVELLGWYISEGSIFNNKKSYTIVISQSIKANKYHYNSIDSLLTRMKIPHCCQAKNISFTSRLFKNFLHKEAGWGSHNKKIPQFIFTLSTEMRKKLFFTMMLGDGNKSGKRYNTISDQLCHDFILLAFTIGIKINNFYKDKSGCWRINLRKRKNNPTIKYKNISKINCCEQTYCITVEKNNIIYAGRNNKFNWIGQCDNFNLENGHFVAGLIAKTYKAKCTNTPLRVWGDGSPLRELLFSEDLGKILVDLLLKDTPDKLLIPGEEVSVMNTATTIAELMGFKGEIIWEKGKPNGQLRKPTDPTRFREIMGDYPFTPYREGLRKTIQWYVERKTRFWGVRGESYGD